MNEDIERELDYQDGEDAKEQLQAALINEQLLPCPFCGSKGAITDNDFDEVYIYCIECDACGPWFYWREEGAKEKAIKNWNKRVVRCADTDCRWNVKQKCVQPDIVNSKRSDAA